MFLDHTQRLTTVTWTPLDEWSARRRDLYLTTHNIYKRKTFIPPVGFDPTIPTGERQQTYALERGHWDRLLCLYINNNYVVLLTVFNSLTFICLRGTTLSYDVAHRTVRSWRQNSFDWFSRWPRNTLRNRMCVAGRSGGKLSAVFLQPIQDRGLYRTEEWFYKEPCFPIQASMTLKSKGMLNTLNT
jgi:hypothetical protein